MECTASDQPGPAPQIEHVFSSILEHWPGERPDLNHVAGPPSLRGAWWVLGKHGVGDELLGPPVLARRGIIQGKETSSRSGCIAASLWPSGSVAWKKS